MSAAAPHDPGPALGLVVEDHGATRDFLCARLKEAFPDIEVAGAGSLAEARAWIGARLARPDGAPCESGFCIALVDLGLPDGNGGSLIRELAENHPDVDTVVMTIHGDDAHVFEAITAGAQGYLLKEESGETLVAHLRRMRQGQPPLSPSVARRMLDHFRGAAQQGLDEPHVTLTPRETEVLSLVGRGLRVGEAAGVLGLADSTVASYVKAIYRKLNVSSRAEAALEAARRGLV